MKIASKRDFDTSGASTGRGLGKVLGGVWSFRGPLRPFLGVVFSFLYLGWSSKGLLEASGALLEALRRACGAFLEASWSFVGDLLEASGVLQEAVGELLECLESGGLLCRMA